MKHTLLTILFPCLALCSQAQTIFRTTFDSQEEFDAWTVINANEDEKTWIFSPSNDAGKRTYYSYDSTNGADDWLISPAIIPEVSGTYLVSYSFTGSSSVESLKMYYGSAPTVDALSENLAAEYPSIDATEHTGFFFVDGKAGEPFYVAFYACSAPDKFRLFAQSLEVKLANNPIDLTITEFVSPVNGENLGSDEKVTLKIANKGMAAAAAGSYSVNLHLGDEDITTETINQDIPVDGEIEVTLSKGVDLSVPHHTYKLIANVNHPDDISSGNNSLTASVRHYGAATEPYSMGFEADEDVSDIKFFNLNEDTGYWSLQINSFWVAPSRTGYRSMCYNYSKVNQADDWAILDGIEMKAGYHVVKFWVSTIDDRHSEAFSLYWGNEATPEAMTNKIAEFDPITQAEYKQMFCIFYLDKDQTVYVGFHATSPADQNWIAIDDVQIETISATDVDLGVSAISMPTDGAFVPLKADHNLSYSVVNNGIADVEGVVVIKIDGEVVSQHNVTLAAQEEKEITVEDFIANLAVGKHTIELVIENDNDNNANNNSMSSTFTIVGTPDIAWDFEDNTVPETFTMRDESTYDLSQEAIEEFGEKGMGIMEIDTHKYYGNYMLAISTWLTEARDADRRLILPKIHVDSEDATFVMNAGSTNASIKESYRIEISDESDSWWDFDNYLSVSGESYVRQNRGVDLGSFVGKDIYVSVHFTTYNGDCLTLDNIGLTGCSLAKDSDASVSNISISDQPLFDFDGQILTFGDFDSVDLSLYNMSGQLIYSATGKTFALSQLPMGVYVLKAATPNGVAIKKIVK